MRWTLLLVLGTGALVIAGTVWATWPGPPKSIGDPSKFKFLYCPQCGREKPYTAVEKEQQCIYCEKTMIGSPESMKQKSQGLGPYSEMVMVVFVEVVGLMFAFWLVARPRTADPHEEFIYMFCESCRQKIRYRERQVGLMALCPRCKQPFTFPELDPHEKI
jgi:hypothetical protein